MKKVTIKDIARISGYSINTVSRALNDKPDINSETRNRILRIADQHNYTPSHAAKSLKSTRTGIIGLVVANISNPFYTNIIRAVENFAFDENYAVLIADSSESVERQHYVLDMLCSKGVEGLLVTPVRTSGESIERLQQIQVPCVLLNRNAADTGFDFVANDNRTGAELAIRHLIENRQKRKIIYLCGPDYLHAAQERIAACRSTVNEYAEKGVTLRVFHSQVDIQDSHDTMKEILDQIEPPFGLFVYNDMMAIGVLLAIREKGFRIPEQISVVGYDDIPISTMLEVPLTTVRQPDYQTGTEAAQILFERIHHEEDQPWYPKQVIFRPELVVRES